MGLLRRKSLFTHFSLKSDFGFNVEWMLIFLRCVAIASHSSQLKLLRNAVWGLDHHPRCCVDRREPSIHKVG